MGTIYSLAMSRVCLCVVFIAVACGPAEGGSYTVIRHRSDTSPSTDGALDASANASTDTSTEGLTVALDNVSSGDTLPYPIALLHGQTNADAPDIRAIVGARETSWPMREGAFFAAVRLDPGNNDVVLRVGDQEHTVQLSYEPQTNDYAVRFIYALAADGDGRFQARDGEPNDATSAKQRMALGAELVQAWLGEASHRAGQARRTFRILRTEAGEPIVAELRSPLSRSELVTMSDNELWSHFYQQLEGQPNRDRTFDHVTIAASRYDAETMTLSARPVLNGSRLAIKGSTDLHTWATSLNEVASRFTDESVIDGTTFYDDSVGRKRAWANYATSLGLVGYHIARRAGLGPTAEGSDILDRGFDHLNRWYVIFEPDHAAGDAIDRINTDQQPSFATANVLWWAHSRYTSLEAKSYTTDAPPLISFGETSVTITASTRLALITYLVDGRIAHYEHFDVPPVSHTVPLSELRALLGTGKTVRVRALDIDGNSAANDVTL